MHSRLRSLALGLIFVLIDFATTLPELFASMCSKRKLRASGAALDIWIDSVDDE
jgi:hypothetical protein